MLNFLNVPAATKQRLNGANPDTVALLDSLSWAPSSTAPASWTPCRRLQLLASAYQLNASAYQQDLFGARGPSAVSLLEELTDYSCLLSLTQPQRHPATCSRRLVGCALARALPSECVDGCAAWQCCAAYSSIE